MSCEEDDVIWPLYTGGDDVTQGGWQIVRGSRRQLSVPAGELGALAVDGEHEGTSCYLVSPVVAPLDASYRLRTRVLVRQPRHGRTVTADLLMNTVDLDNTYLVRFRVRNGVRYLTLTKRRDGKNTDIVDDIISFDFDRWLSVEISCMQGTFEIRVDGAHVVRGSDFDQLSGGSLGVGVDGASAVFDRVESTLLGSDQPTDDPEAIPRPPPGRPTGRTCEVIEGGRYRLEVIEAAAASGPVFGTQLFARDAEDEWQPVSGDDQFVVLRGDRGSPRDLLASLDRGWVTFTSLEVVDRCTVRLRARDPEGFDLSATWSLAGTHPRVHLSLRTRSPGHHVIGCLGFRSRHLDDVEEVLCGPLQHAKMVRGTEATGLSELMAPLCLVQHTEHDQPLTVGLFVPGEQLSFEYEPSLADDDQPCGMSLRNHEGAVQPILYAPQYGRRSWLEPGDEHSFELGLVAQPTELFEVYRDLLRTEYRYRAYRGNVFDTSLTDTVHNLIDLLKSGPDEDDSIDFRPSPSGWWSRAKGFIDIENDQAVRATTTSVLLGAYYLTADDELYEHRALPTIEYHLSRNGYGWTPRPDGTVYGDPGRNQLCSTPFGAPALAPLYSMSRGGLPVAASLAAKTRDDQDYWLQRTAMSAPLATYRMTRDPADLRLAHEAARAYVAEHLDSPYEDNVDPHDFQNYYSKAWVELLEMYEETKDDLYLDAAYREAKRFVTQVFVRPVPSGSLTVPSRPLVIDQQINLKGWWDPNELFDYPRSDVDDEDVPCWMVSPNGLSFEALKTYRLNGFSMNPAWAPRLLRLGHLTGDDLLRDVAHNAAVGRFTNYPGYYYRQYSVNHMKPDFPYLGPFGNTTIYYHHAPAQLGMAMDYLLTEHQTRSAGNICFPAEFEQNYVWFAFRVHGHRPGRFYGHDGVWLWMPKGIVSTGNAQVNWVTAVGSGRFFVSLTNESDHAEDVRLVLNRDLVPRPDGRGEVTVIRDNGEPVNTTMEDGRLDTTVSGKGITALVVHDVGDIDEPLHTEPWARISARHSYHFDDDGPVGSVRGILIPKPDGSRYHAYVQAATDRPATLHYSIGDDMEPREAACRAYPYEWTIPVDDLTQTFSYYVRAGDDRSEPVTLWCAESTC